MSVVVRFRQQTRANASVPMALWAVVMAIVLVMEVLGSSPRATTLGLVATALLGVWLGWRRRGGAVFVAPFVSWMVAWLPMMIAAIVHDGVVKGFFVGLVLVTVGWIGIGFVEFVWLGLVTMLVRALRGARHRNEIEIIEPFVDPPH
ncbi:MAG TPA: hypothetical protein PLG60_02530 [Acidimicrobiales bacterium]|nr:hypothetical protein [Acidimicrobiales bacterium]